ncbi:aminotransferase class V-fold PLP-dependent enzyme [Actinacidiphila alni]|uniref:aminotransferase class V-fold PLP-dependent enzyme n=1 Tax=Actinacidiphila alni TaxID=380248 RepID=UPI0015A67975|nr:aminotransferase class V-fold PLP-dependent enzyme [Actinacidiphila alni]
MTTNDTTAPTTAAFETGRVGRIGIGPADRSETDATIGAFTDWLLAEEPHIAGFPGNLSFDYSRYGALLATLCNSVGDPGSPDASGVGGKTFERRILEFLTDFTRGDRDHTYGYLTSGASEANLFGLLTARTTLPRAPVYVTAATHYSVTKAARILRMDVVQVPMLADDTMDPGALAYRTAARRGGAIVVATTGTTMLGSTDDLPALRQAAAASGPVYVHVDGALGGWITPFEAGVSVSDFSAGADSIALSAHKWPGHPLPTGIALARRHLVSAVAAGEYIGATDHTMACSRSGTAAVILWAALRGLGYHGLRRMTENALAVAEHLHTRLTALGLGAQRHGITVSFALPPSHAGWDALRARWHLPAQHRGGVLLTHVITVPHLGYGQVDELADDVAAVLARNGGAR